MLSRWCLLLAGAVLAAGALAPAAAAAARPGRGAAAGQPLRPGMRLARPGVELLRPGSGQAAPGAVPLTGGPLANGTSSNWSGYAATGGTYTQVAASWVQPQASCSRGNQYASFWIGLDGFGNSNTVEQAGTEADCAGGSPRYYAWYELYPAYPVNFRDAVQPGDHITASVTANGGGSYTLTIDDSTRGWNRTVSGTDSRAANSSAEVIAEAPSTHKGVLRLTDFGSVTFTGATVNGTPLGSLNPSEVTMVDGAGRYKDIVSPLSGGGSFGVAWQRGS